MTKILYALKDTATGFSLPTTFDNDYVAIRQFKAYMAESRIMSDNPKDFILYRIGSFDTDTGFITQDSSPVLVCDNLSEV